MEGELEWIKPSIVEKYKNCYSSDCLQKVMYMAVICIIFILVFHSFCPSSFDDLIVNYRT
jgi:hypothetical protein